MHLWTPVHTLHQGYRVVCQGYAAPQNQTVYARIKFNQRLGDEAPLAYIKTEYGEECNMWISKLEPNILKKCWVCCAILDSDSKGYKFIFFLWLIEMLENPPLSVILCYWDNIFCPKNVQSSKHVAGKDRFWTTELPCFRVLTKWWPTFRSGLRKTCSQRHDLFRKSSMFIYSCT